MLLLPPEVLLEVFQRLVKSDLKEVRLSCKAFRFAASNWLFDTVYISAHDTDRDVLKELAKDPLLSNCVRYLRYDASQFCAHLSKQDYLKHLCRDLQRIFADGRSVVRTCNHHLRSQTLYFDSPNACVNKIMGMITSESYRDKPDLVLRHICDKFSHSDFVDQGYNEYMKCAQGQASRGERYWDDICRLLLQFKRLKNFTIHHGWSDKIDPRSETLRIATYNEILPSGSPLARSWNVLHLRPFGWSSESYNNSCSDGEDEFRIFCSFPKSLGQVAIRLEVDRSTLGLPLAPFRNPLEQDTLHSLAQLEFLDLNFYSREFSATNAFRPLVGLRSLLASIPRLKELKLALPLKTGLDEDEYTVDQVFPLSSTGWPNLKSFDIEGLGVDPASLIFLFSVNMPNLCSLRFSRVRLSNGTWEQVIEYIACCMSLSEVHICPEWGLLYTDSTVWSEEEPVKAIDEVEEGTLPEEHTAFIEAIQDYILYRGRHPLLGHTSTQPLRHDLIQLLQSAQETLLLPPSMWDMSLKRIRRELEEF
ncbi:MAG: hypothetical protein Q9201_007625 [Fulgogasparrea decipioides]